MKEKESITKYRVPIILVAFLLAVLIMGMNYLRDSLMALTAEERSSQLEEIVAQMRVNVENGLSVHWNLASGINNAAQGRHFDDMDDLYRGIAELEQNFCTDLYGSRIMLLDSQGAGYLTDGSIGIWYDVMHLTDGEHSHTFVSETDNIDGCYLVFSMELDSPITVGVDDSRFTHLVLLKEITTLKQYYTTASYGGNAATYIIRENGTLTYFDSEASDLIGARNVYKALREVEYLGGSNFEQVEENMQSEGIAVANVLIEGDEYYYCLADLDAYSMVLLLLIPAGSVAVSTLSMMDSALRIQTFFSALVAVIALLAFVSAAWALRSKRAIDKEMRLNKELNELREAAEQANAAKSAFLNNMSHDIRTPMNAIVGFTNIALKHNPSEEVASCLKKIEGSSEHLLTLINDVLDISRIESGKIQLVPVPVDISEVTETVVNIIYGFLTDRSIDFSCELQKPEHPYVLADVVRVREVLINILGNAVKFTNDGGSITFQAEYSLSADEKSLLACYRIADTGVGMSEDFVKHIFDEFSQEDNSARTRYKGTGLGMAITKRYVDMMGGSIYVTSEKGKGSVFTVELPMALTDESNVVKPEVPSGNENLEGIKVLLAEDNDLNAEIATIQLEELGLIVTRAVDGEEAVRLFAENAPGSFDIILMDIMMPVMNGYEATKAIRDLPGRPDAVDIPIIAMTANVFAEDVRASMDADMNGHLSKPIVIKEVVSTIARNIKS